MINEEGITTIPAKAPRPGSSLEPQRLAQLLLQPRAYFADGKVLLDRGAILAAAYLAGISSTMDRIDQKVVQADMKNAAAADPLTTWMAESWLHYWLMVLLIGVVSAKILWHLGGWWYKTRLHWSGDKSATPHDARRVYVLQFLPYTASAVLMTMVQTALYENYGEAWAADNITAWIAVPLAFWSCWTSYCAATTVFPLEKFKARIWFLILPIVFYVLTIGVVTAVLAMLHNRISG